MRTFLLRIGLLLTLSAGALNGQSLDSALAYFPLATGDLWQFRYRVATCTDCYLYYFTLGVEGDTLMPNGRAYKIQVERRPGTTTVAYLRIDILGANVYQYYGGTPDEFLIDSLRARPGQRFGTFPLYRFCWSAASDTVAGLPYSTISFGSGIGSPVYTYAYGIGLAGVYEPEGANGFPYSSDFVYARVNGREYGTLASAVGDRLKLTSRFELSQNYPNPFNPATTIRYALPQRSHVTLTVFNALGQQVATLVNESQDPGFHDVPFNGGGLASGVYIYRLQAGEYVQSRTLVLLK